MAGLYGLAAVTFLVLISSDLIDGYIARRLGHVSDAGKWLDPLADKVLIVSSLIMLTGLGKVDPLPVVVICVRDMMVASIRTHKLMAATYIAKYKTFFQNLAILMIMLSLPYSGWVLWFSIVLSLFSGVLYLWESKVLHHL